MTREFTPSLPAIFKEDQNSGESSLKSPSPTPASAYHQINSTRSSTASTRSTLRKPASMRDQALV